MEIYTCRVNHLDSPLGFLMNRTVFAWKMAQAAGSRMVSARIRIASDPQMQHILTDTGDNAEANPLGWQITLPLHPRTRYYWTVSARDDSADEALSSVQWFETGKMQEPWTGRWITCDSLEQRHPLFEKEIIPKKKVRSARLYLCGLGLYEAYWNEEKIGKEYLAPGCNDYHEWLQYQTFDITREMSVKGRLSVLLGNGWYKGRFSCYSKPGDQGFYGTEWKLIAEVRMEYEDGTTEVIGTDESWSVKRSRIFFSSIYDGEQQDDTLPDLPVTMASFCSAPKGKLTERLSLPVIVHEQMTPVILLYTPEGDLVLDMGQEFAGIFRLHIRVPAGRKIRIQTGEMLMHGCFCRDNLRTAASEYVYISDGKEKEISPHFTYYGYRYVKVEGIPDLKKEDFTGLALYSDVREAGKIRTGHDQVNRLISNVLWGLRSNFVDVPTDCPQRDERMGWTGDAQVFSQTATYLCDTYSFYRKYLYDMAKEQKALGGKVPDVVPSCGITSTSSVWGDSCCIIPWNLYVFYGDSSILEEQYESMKDWAEYMLKVDATDHGWRKVFHYGDWLALDNPIGGKDQVLGGTDEGFIAAVYLAGSVQILAKAAEITGRTQDAARYCKISENQFESIRDEYYSRSGRCCIHTQTALLLTLKYHLSCNEELTRAQLRQLFELNGDRLMTGFVGTPLMCSILSENGMSDIAFRLLLNEEYPGWLHEIRLGATTVWERWNSVMEDGSMSSTGMNSLNHYSYGAVLEWMFRHVGGISPQEDRDPRNMLLTPDYNWHLKEADCFWNSAAGTYRVAWKLQDSEHVKLCVEVPFNCSADLVLPYAGRIVPGDEQNPVLQHMHNGICRLAPGQYEISYQLDRSLIRTYTLDDPVCVIYSDPDVRMHLESVFPFAHVPLQYRGYSFRQIKEMISSFPEEELYRIEEVLQSMENRT
ncbi:MAG: glycoside hydrolase family 78 protein [Butyrivibrio sp.]|nr:glycoside hydrolase family 78 protein [Butyrivibrio sp.]